jgi:predicted DNA-binding protein YlxM (UPF0122 family)
MSHRDRDLIRYAGLSVEAVASLLGRTRQAIYQGMSSTTRHYFGTSEVLLMFQDAKRRKLKYLDTLRSFIETEYDPNLAELIAPDRINDSRAVRLIEESQEIILGINGSEDVINPNSAFTSTLDTILKIGPRRLWLVAAAAWIRDYFRARVAQLHPDSVLAELPITFVIDGKMGGFPSFCLLSGKGAQNGFWFGLNSLDPLTSDNAARLWNLVYTTILGGPLSPAEDHPNPARAERSHVHRRA